MKKIPLLPGYFKWIGVVLVLLSILLSIIYFEDQNHDLNVFVISSSGFYQQEGFMEVVKVDVGRTIVLSLIMVGLAFISFARMKVEDEMINSIRLYSWTVTVILMVVLGVLITLTVYGYDYVYFIAFFIPLLLLSFILIFYYNYYRLARKEIRDEE